MSEQFCAPVKSPDLYNIEGIVELLKGERRKTVGITGKFSPEMDPVWDNAIKNGRAHYESDGKAEEGEVVGDSKNRSIVLHRNSPEAVVVANWRKP